MMFNKTTVNKIQQTIIVRWAVIVIVVFYYVSPPVAAALSTLQQNSADVGERGRVQRAILDFPLVFLNSAALHQNKSSFCYCKLI